ncbi:Methyltransferase domain-containing protein [Pustulibacterium marinum]|uniref:Methyltransferase domain-containing protein n=1 Tax=Pustulibacterium marinum TaxID=1224947 RepID=A0A1I7F0U1_9FLAO|nr:class I SAM-dependent methyltransferase [Pustulibacterium marinum]SFU29791.1 Methyltransferase domain-containing protein [Pustulibacterium marinum]
MKEFWNERYAAEAFAYGETPNVYVEEKLSEIAEGGKVLFPAEGEGRNAVYAATKGFEVEAFDMSISGKEKALQLADKLGVKIRYELKNLKHITYPEAIFDGLILIYAHFPADIRKEGFHKLCKSLKPGGIVIFEAFAKDQLQYTSGGPKNEAMLFSEEEIPELFPDFTFKEIGTHIIDLEEGLYHIGKGSVVRFVGIKSE